jgi:hypothetical protein
MYIHMTVRLRNMYSENILQGGDAEVLQVKIECLYPCNLAYATPSFAALFPPECYIFSYILPFWIQLMAWRNRHKGQCLKSLYQTKELVCPPVTHLTATTL